MTLLLLRMNPYFINVMVNKYKIVCSLRSRTFLLLLTQQESSCLRAFVLPVFSVHEILFSRYPNCSLTSFRWLKCHFITLSEMSPLTTLYKIAIVYSPYAFPICITYWHIKYLLSVSYRQNISSTEFRECNCCIPKFLGQVLTKYTQ